MRFVHKDLGQAALVDPVNAAETILVDLTPICHTLFLNYAEYWDTAVIEQRLLAFSALVNHLKTARPQLKIFFLVDAWWEKYKELIADIQFDDVLYVDYFIYRIHKELIEKNRNPIAYRWNNNADKFLFLTGFPYRTNRIRLLKKLDECNLMQNAVWSLYCNDQDAVTRARVHQLVPEMTTSEFNAFIEKYRRNPDNIKLRSVDGGYNGLPYDVKLYTGTAFSVIPETLYDSKYHPYFTEKTWKAVVNYHPFIIAGPPGSLSKLHQLGLVTFEEFLLIKDYDTIECSEARLDAIAANVGWWQHKIGNFKQAISEGVVHNRQMFGSLYTDNVERIRQFCQRNDFEYIANSLIATEQTWRPDIYTSTEIEKDLLRTQAFKTFYQQIRDASWPDCNSEEEFVNLPAFIQKECEDVFGYVKLDK